MIVTHELTLDLTRSGAQPPVCVMQNDSDTRQLKLTLLAASVPWQPGDGIAASVAYKKPDGTKGWYDTLPDGQTACAIAENLVAATLAPQMLTVSGNVTAAVVFMDADLNRIATFPFCIQVQADPAAGETVSNDYYNYSTMEDINAQFASLEAELFTTSTRLSQLDDSASIVCDAAGEQITLTDASNRALQGLTVYGKTTQDGTPTPETPVELESAGAGGSIAVTIGDYITSKMVPGITNADGSYNSANPNRITTEDYCCIWAGNYILNCAGGTSCTIVVFDLDGNVITNESYADKWYIFPLSLSIKGDRKIKISISGTTDTSYKPLVYKENEPVQTLTLSTPNGLPGIPVPSVGNYTDENGQAWICDEVDFARGVYVQRISTVDMGNLTYNYNTDGLRFITTIGTMKYDGKIDYPVLSTCYRSQYNKGYGVSKDYAISTYYPYGRWIGIGDPRTTDSAELKELLTGETLMYIRQTPIETALSAEELAAYAALHTNKPNTTIYNDASAHMQLRYIADTKTYIDNKFNELAAAIVNNT